MRDRVTHEPMHSASWLQIAMRQHIVRRSLQVGAVVGIILNIVNQGQSVLRGHPIAWGHVVMNFVVPYIVATYSAACNERSQVHRAN